MMRDETHEGQANIVEASQPGLVSIVVPTRNEAANIQTLVHRLSEAMGEGTLFELVFVDDSTDNTPQVIRETAVASPVPIHLIARPPEQRNGLSGAVVDGFRAANGSWLCVMDADLQHPPEVIPHMLARAVEANADLVVGSRQADLSGPRGLSRRRAMTSQLLTLLARAWFPRLLKNVSDPLTGLFLVRREAIDVDALRPDGFKILLEILIRCPGLRVSEIHFEFATRHGGESKADLREGIRFFRHLLRLRATANQSFPRLILVALASLLLDTAVFVILTNVTGWFYGLTAVITAELFILLRFYATEKWVLGGGHPVPGWPSFGRFFISNQLSLFLVRLPLLYLFITLWTWPLGIAAFTAVIIEGVIRYIFSEQWAFSLRSWSMSATAVYHYDLHQILNITSQIPLPELAYFETSNPPSRTDIQIRVDRHGTPSSQPGAICYDEKLNRFGFGVAIMPGEFTEIVVAPALEKSPYALYKSILEPLLRWAFAQKGYVLIYGGCVAFGSEAFLLVPEAEIGKTEVVLAASRQDGYAFMSDDFTILSPDGRVFSYPKPISVTKEVLAEMQTTTHTPDSQRLKFWLQSLFYSQKRRTTGLRYGRRNWPVATLNIYWQRLMPPPKQDVKMFIPEVVYGEGAQLTELFLLETGPDQQVSVEVEKAIQFLQKRQGEVTGFPPYDYLVAQLAQWGEQDLSTTEQEIVAAALNQAKSYRLVSQQGQWWQDLLMLYEGRPLPDGRPLTAQG